jgi:Spy/CpxP family protein refolding chaperone
MRHTLAFLAAVGLFSVASISWIAAEQTRTVANANPSSPSSTEELLLSIRNDIQADRADMMAKNLSLSAEQAAKFWPLYDAYQKEQNVIIDDQFNGIQRYMESSDALDDAGALAFMKTHLDRDAKMTALRQKALGDFQSVLGTKLAVRAIQIDRRLSLIYQLKMTPQIPLVH